MTIVGITPARGGSKGIPRKNIKLLAGKPLIAWTIERALEAHFLDKYFVSTDDKEIAKISKEYGAEVISRPPMLATDTSPIIDTLIYIRQEQIFYDSLVLLQAPCPIRNEGRIDECIEIFNKSMVDSVVTGYQNYCIDYGTDVGKSTNRQERKGFFWDDGNVYVFSGASIVKGKLKTKNYIPVYVTREESLDIEDEFDFWIVEQVLLKRMKKK